MKQNFEFENKHFQNSKIGAYQKIRNVFVRKKNKTTKLRTKLNFLGVTKWLKDFAFL